MRSLVARIKLITNKQINAFKFNQTFNQETVLRVGALLNYSYIPPHQSTNSGESQYIYLSEDFWVYLLEFSLAGGFKISAV